ncbi:ABC transporter ATP-binding protein [Catenuloplanes indicus]|uniref:ABC-2 type transport system ATP-binding protein n=1 Tax=Catenuloplanes indicus TaxID=137267 RepID=A0AAE3VWK7_9ACTN|nr:ATP-binding cassette domain-containing protein [Catenuloplanes indicus]MDQ0364932.1 ABC-2 type transport system ATP-binding protein [Catenuloplanes indicus]
MALIEAAGLRKVFRRPVKDPGLGGALRHLVTRRYTDLVAVDEVDLSIEAGESVAYIGANGAGKSTTVKLLSGILVPTAGQVRVGGTDPHRHRIANARRIGVLFGQRSQLWWDLPVRDSLALLRDIYRVGDDDYRRRLERFDEVLGLGELLPVVARKLSLGQRMRADLAAALLHAPDVVYLDEPTIGLDLAVKDRVRAFLRALRQDGTTIMLTTHDLGDIEDVCDRLVIIEAGRIVYDGALSRVKDEYVRERRMRLSLDRDPAGWTLPGAVVTPGATGREIVVTFDRLTLTAGAVIAAVSAHAEVLEVHIDEPTIEDLVRRLYAGDLTLAAQT